MSSSDDEIRDLAGAVANLAGGRWRNTRPSSIPSSRVALSTWAKLSGRLTACWISASSRRCCTTSAALSGIRAHRPGGEGGLRRRLPTVLGPRGGTAVVKTRQTSHAKALVNRGCREATEKQVKTAKGGSGCNSRHPYPADPSFAALPRNLDDEPPVPDSPGEPNRFARAGLDDRPVRCHPSTLLLTKPSRREDTGVLRAAPRRRSPHRAGRRRSSTGGCRPSPASPRRRAPAGR